MLITIKQIAIRRSIGFGTYKTYRRDHALLVFKNIFFIHGSNKTLKHNIFTRLLARAP